MALRKEIVTGIIIFSLAFILFAIGTAYLGYSSPDEKRYAQSAQEMVEGGDWITPHYHGRPRFQKPILFYWLAAFSSSILGGGWFAARLPSIFFGAMMVFLVYLLGRDLYNRRTGLFSAAFLSISTLFFAYTRLCTPDMTLLFFITLSIYIFCRLYFLNLSGANGLLFFLALALAALTKGFAGILIPLFIIGVFSAIFKKPGLIRRLNIPAGLILFLFVISPWFIAMYKIHGAAYIDHIWRVETLGRLSGQGGANMLLGVIKGIARYLIMTILLFLPTTAFLPWATRHIAKERREANTAFIILWALTVVLFFSLFGTRKAHYLLPIAPPLSLMIGIFAADKSSDRRFLRFAQVIIVSSLFILVTTFGSIIPALNRDNGLLRLSDKILLIRSGDEAVGIGSHFISHNRVDSYLGINVKKVNADLKDPVSQAERSRGLLSEFLERDERVFCLIIRDDYEVYIPKNLKGRTYILDKAWYWKKPNQYTGIQPVVRAIIRGDSDGLKHLIKNEIYLISNRDK
ncbi:MAG: glycosyltransferase family 39 protein [Candidatus Omnitrophica bacterium]|nr:glycosyltransferase family 39 protein [Candidatus Omnitrophota bacterium]